MNKLVLRRNRTFCCWEVGTVTHVQERKISDVPVVDISELIYDKMDSFAWSVFSCSVM